MMTEIENEGLRLAPRFEYFRALTPGRCVLETMMVMELLKSLVSPKITIQLPVLIKMGAYKREGEIHEKQINKKQHVISINLT